METHIENVNTKQHNCFTSINISNKTRTPPVILEVRVVSADVLGMLGVYLGEQPHFRKHLKAASSVETRWERPSLWMGSCSNMSVSFLTAGSQGDRGDKGATGAGLDGPAGDQGPQGRPLPSNSSSRGRLEVFFTWQTFSLVRNCFYNLFSI